MSTLAGDSGSSHQGESNVSGTTADDFHENTDVVRYSNETHNVYTDNDAQKELTKGEVNLGDITEDEAAPEPVTIVEWVDKVLPNGNIIKVKVTRTVIIKKSKVIRQIRDFWNKSISLDSVKPIVIAFTDKFGQELNQTQLNLFNYIGTTDDEGSLGWNYNYVQIRLEHLKKTLKAITEIFYTPLSQDELNTLEARIRTCNSSQAVAISINTDAGESYTASGWTVRVEAFFSTCGKGKPGVQLATFAAHKSGGWVTADKFSCPNSRTVDDIITQWLIRHLHLLFTCKEVGLPVKQTACSDFEGSSHHSRRRI
jgi:hypothetical protein